jgi:hypothetical protein
MSKARDPEPVRPSEEAIKAREEAAAAADRAEQHLHQQEEKLAEATEEMVRLVSHRRANRFADLFREALQRRGGAHQ